jgi:hypothetical protein
MFLFAAAFLFEAWIWDRLVSAVRWILDRIPWAEFRGRARARFNRWPAIVSVVSFGVPFLVVEGGCTVSVVLIALGQVLIGTFLYIFLKICLLTMVAVIFDLTKEKLMTLSWFVLIYDKLAALHHYAHQLIAPYREGAMRLLRKFRGPFRAWQWRFAVRSRAGRASALPEAEVD